MAAFLFWQPDGALKICVQVQPKARCTKIFLREGTLRIQVPVLPEDGKANQAVIRVLAETFVSAPTRVTLLSGATAKKKCFLVQPPLTLPTWLVDHAAED